MSSVLHSVNHADQVTADIMGLIHQQFPNLHDLTTETDLLAAGIMDSLSLMDLIVGIESQFQITLPPSAIQPRNFRTVRSLSELVQQQL